MFALKDAPIGNAKPYIDLNSSTSFNLLNPSPLIFHFLVTFSMANATVSSNATEVLVEVVFFHHSRSGDFAMYYRVMPLLPLFYHCDV